MNEISTYHQEEIVCPWCGCKHDPSGFTKDHGRVECDKCKNKFYFDGVYVYDTEKVAG